MLFSRLACPSERFVRLLKGVIASWDEQWIARMLLPGTFPVPIVLPHGLDTSLHWWCLPQRKSLMSPGRWEDLRRTLYQDMMHLRQVSSLGQVVKDRRTRQRSWWSLGSVQS